MLETFNIASARWRGWLAVALGGIAWFGSVSAGELRFRLPPVDISAGSVSGVTSVGIADLDRDGLPDITVFEGGKHAAGRQTFAWFRAPDWVRHEFNRSLSPGPFLGHSAFADIDGDGWVDLVLPEDPHSGSREQAGHLYWFRNPGGDATGAWQRHAIGTWPGAIHIGDMGVADMDRDGRPDIVIRHLGTNTVRICFQDSPTEWTTRAMAVRLREGLLLADIDRDGRTDIVLNGFWWKAPAKPRTERYMEYVIDPAFFSQPAVRLNNSTKAAVGDIDGDGIDDLVMVPAEGQKAHLAWHKCPKDPTAGAWGRQVIENEWGNMHQVLLGDFDRDGDLDIAGGLSFGDKGVYIWLNNGRGRSWLRTTLTADEGLYYGVAGDIGADDDLDIVGPTTYSKTARPLLYENLAQPETGHSTR